MNRSGFTLIEALVVIVLIGIVGAFAFPRIGRELERQNVRSARAALTTMHAKARATAIQRGRAVALVCQNNELFILSQHPVTGAVDTVDRRDLMANYGVTLAATRDSLVFDPRGLGMEGGATTMVVSRSGYADTVRITPVGSIVR